MRDEARKILRACQAFWISLKTKNCAHNWRPALANGKPARHCDQCKVTQHITETEFYAQFGKMPRKIEWKEI